MNTINEQRRHAATHKSEVWVQEAIQDGFYQDVRQLSVALNLRYETGVRDCFERSFEALLSRFETSESSISDSIDKDLRGSELKVGLEDIKLLSNDAALDLRVRKQAFQLELSLVYSKTNVAVELSPSAQQVERDIVGVVSDAADTLTSP